MFGHRELTFDDYMAILRRRIWMIAIPAVITPILTYLVSLKLPRQYTSSAKVLIQQPQVSPDLIHSVVTQRVDQRLALMRQQVLSRTRLQPIIERYSLYKELASNGPEGMVEKMRSIIDLRLLTAEANGHTEVSGFTLSFTANTPTLAQQICSEITSLFLEENLHYREQMATGTTKFLDRQLQEAKKKLDDQDTLLAQFKSKYLGQLPGREETNMNVLNSLNNQLEAITQSISRARQDKTYTESILTQQLAVYEAMRRGGANEVSLEQQLENLQDQLVILQARYTPEHPDVIKTKNDIAQLQSKIREAHIPSKSGMVDNSNSEGEEKALSLAPPAIQQMRHQIREYDLAIKDRTREQDRLQREISMYQGRLNLSPVVEEQYKQMTRDYQVALNSYNELLAKKNQSQISEDLERRQEGEQFLLTEAANYPTKPSFPDPVKFTLGGFGGGLAFGFILALMMELRDKSVRTDQDVESHLELPVIAILPQVGQEFSNGQKQMRFWKRERKPQLTSYRATRA